MTREEERQQAAEIDVEGRQKKLREQGITVSTGPIVTGTASKPAKKTRSDKGTHRPKPAGVLNEAQAAHLDGLIEAQRQAEVAHQKSADLVLAARRAYYAYLDELQGKK